MVFSQLHFKRLLLNFLLFILMLLLFNVDHLLLMATVVGVLVHFPLIIQLVIVDQLPISLPLRCLADLSPLKRGQALFQELGPAWSLV